jgi:hypothetical protein
MTLESVEILLRPVARAGIGNHIPGTLTEGYWESEWFNFSIYKSSLGLCQVFAPVYQNRLKGTHLYYYSTHIKNV